VDVNPIRPTTSPFAVDALETDELKAFDARLDGIESGAVDELGAWREVLGGLAATAADEPPVGLRERMLDAALAKRAIGAPMGEVEEIPANEAYRRTIAVLGQLLVDLGPTEWDAPTIEGWTVKGLVTHLVAVEEYFGRQLGLWPLEIDEALEADHLGMTREFVTAWSDRPAAEVLARWQELTAAITAHLAGLDRAPAASRSTSTSSTRRCRRSSSPGLRGLDPRRGHPPRHRPLRRPPMRPACAA
jgi:uncharacterized protein (TIGR03083 family)